MLFPTLLQSLPTAHATDMKSRWSLYIFHCPGLEGGREQGRCEADAVSRYQDRIYWSLSLQGLVGMMDRAYFLEWGDSIERNPDMKQQ